MSGRHCSPPEVQSPRRAFINPALQACAGSGGGSGGGEPSAAAATSAAAHPGGLGRIRLLIVILASSGMVDDSLLLRGILIPPLSTQHPVICLSVYGPSSVIVKIHQRTAQYRRNAETTGTTLQRRPLVVSVGFERSLRHFL
jgi:hypothetical protein